MLPTISVSTYYKCDRFLSLWLFCKYCSLHNMQHLGAHIYIRLRNYIVAVQPKHMVSSTLIFLLLCYLPLFSSISLHGLKPFHFLDLFKLSTLEVGSKLSAFFTAKETEMLATRLEMNRWRVENSVEKRSRAGCVR